MNNEELNKLSDRLTGAILPLIQDQSYLNNVVEDVLRVAHELYTCPECGVRPCDCGLPFGYLEDLE